MKILSLNKTMETNSKNKLKQNRYKDEYKQSKQHMPYGISGLIG